MFREILESKDIKKEYDKAMKLNSMLIDYDDAKGIKDRSIEAQWSSANAAADDGLAQKDIGAIVGSIELYHDIFKKLKMSIK